MGGHTQFLQLDESTVCKPLIPRELSFYLNAPPEIRTFTPQWKGNAPATDGPTPVPPGEKRNSAH